MSQELSLAFKIAKEGRKRHAKRGRHLCDVLEAQIAFAALDGAHEGPVDAALVGERLLGIALLRPEFSDPLPQCLQEQI